MGNISSISMNSGYTVSVTNLVSQVGAELVVGVAHNATLTTATYGWLATRGVVVGLPDNVSTISANSGDFLTVGLNGGFVSAPATIATGHRLAICLNSFISYSGATTIANRILFKSPLFG
jgi:hypothetical protein